MGVIFLVGIFLRWTIGPGLKSCLIYCRWSTVIHNKKFNYFLIDGGKDLIDSLKNDCKKILGAEYIFAYPYHDSLMYSGYHIFSYLTEDGKYQFENNYVLEN